MRYDLKTEAMEAKDYLADKILQGKIVEIKVVRKTRSLQANAYLHLLLQICGNEWGYSLDEIKIIWKRDIAPSIFVYFKNDQPFTKSSAALDTKEISEAIEQLKRYAAEQDLILPEPHEEEKLRYYENIIDRSFV